MTANKNPLESLDAAFILPKTINDNKLRALYEVIVHRMRKEASHLPMLTMNELMIERNASFYIHIKFKEKFPMGDPQGFQNPTQQKDFNNFWLTMTSDLNKVVRSSDSNERESILREVRDIVLDVVGEIDDQQLKATVLNKMSDRFDQAGI